MDPTVTQRLLWRQILRWTAVTSSVLVAAAAVTLIGNWTLTAPPPPTLQFADVSDPSATTGSDAES